MGFPVSNTRNSFPSIDVVKPLVPLERQQLFSNIGIEGFRLWRNLQINPGDLDVYQPNQGCSVDIQPYSAKLKASSTASGFIKLRTTEANNQLFHINQPPGIIDYSKDIVVCLTLCITSLFSQNTIFSFFFGASNSILEPFVQKNFGVFIKGSDPLTLFTRDGMAPVNKPTSFTPEINKTFELKLENSSGRVRLFVNGTLLATNSSPVGSSPMNLNEINLQISNSFPLTQASEITTGPINLYLNS